MNWRGCNKRGHKNISSIIEHFNFLVKKEGGRIKIMGVYDCPICHKMHLTRQIDNKQITIKKMGNEVAVQPAVKPLSLAERKNNIQAALVKHELELQGLCNNVTDEKLVATIADFKSKWKGMQANRKEFTNYVSELLIDPFIAIEKRVDPASYKPFKDLEARELKIRQDKVSEANKTAEKNKEKVAYKEHVLNEFHRVFNDRKIKMLYEIGVAIKNKIPVSSPELLEVLTEVANAPRVYNKMETKYLEPAEKLEIAKSIIAPNYPQLIKDMQADAVRLEDNVNREGEKDEPVDDDLDALVAAAVTKASEDHAEERVQNSMIASQVVEVGSTPKIIKKRKIVVENTKAWAEAIISSFYQYDVAWLMLKSKNFDKVTIGQMAEALSKCPDITVEGVEYKEEEK